LAWKIDPKLHDSAIGLRLGRVAGRIGCIGRVEHKQHVVREMGKVDNDVGALGGRQQKAAAPALSVAQPDGLVEQAAIGADLPDRRSGANRGCTCDIQI
jgi:hypothetical protein